MDTKVVCGAYDGLLYFIRGSVGGYQRGL